MRMRMICVCLMTMMVIMTTLWQGTHSTKVNCKQGKCKLQCNTRGGCG